LVVPPYSYCIEELEDPHDVALEETREEIMPDWNEV
jgi:hypothetical protein